MGENPRIMCEIADALREEEEHRRWADENGYHADIPNCQHCEKVAELLRQVNYWKNRYLSTTFDYKEKIFDHPF